jgi:hypothetical protein
MLEMINAACGVINEAFGFAEFAIGTAVVLFAMVLAFLGYAASRPADNPLRVVAGLLVARLGMTLGIGIVDVPLALLEPVGGIIDAGSILFLVGYWLTFFVKAARAFMPPRPGTMPAPPAPPTIIYMQPQQQPGQALMPMPTFERQPYAPAPPYPAE